MANKNISLKANRHKNLGRYFREKRIKAGLSQEDVASALGYTSIQIVSNWERGLCSPPSKILKKLTQLFKLNKVEVMNFLTQQSQLEYKSLLGIKAKKSKSKKKKK